MLSYTLNEPEKELDVGDWITWGAQGLFGQIRLFSDDLEEVLISYKNDQHETRTKYIPVEAVLKLCRREAG